MENERKLAKRLRERVLEIVEEDSWDTEVGLFYAMQDLIRAIPEDKREEVVEEVENFT